MPAALKLSIASGTLSWRRSSIPVAPGEGEGGRRREEGRKEERKGGKEGGMNGGERGREGRKQ